MYLLLIVKFWEIFNWVIVEVSVCATVMPNDEEGFVLFPMFKLAQLKVPAPEILAETSSEGAFSKVTSPLTASVTPVLTDNVPKFPVVAVLKYKLVQDAFAVTVTV